jgi:rhamnosyltransferase
MKDNIYALMTVHYPNESVPKNADQISKQVTTLIILDNTPDFDNSYLFNDVYNAIYINNGNNFGLSKAFNKCLKLGIIKNNDFVLFLDQDSFVHDNLVRILFDDFITLQNKGIKIGCIGPVYYETNRKKVEIPKIKKELYNSIYEVKAIITSSMFTSYANLEMVGFWNEDIFLDLADWDLCWRLQKSGMFCCITKNAILNHTLGESVKKIGFFVVKEGAAIREYYQTRDCLKLLFKTYTPLKYKLRFVLMLTVRPIIHMLFLSDKLKRLKYIFSGIYDFFKHSNGAYIGFR